MVKKTTDKKEKDLSLGILDLKGKEVGKYELNPKVFDGNISSPLLHQAVVAYLANQRKGLAQTKTKGQVRGGGRKPWRQKGTGRARVGSIRSPIWRGGGVTFGPHPRSYYKELPKKMKVFALKSALNAKLKDNQILVLDDLGVASCRTKEFFKILNNLKLDAQKVRLVVGKIEKNLKFATRNIKTALLAKAKDIHTTQVIDCKKLVLTKSALKEVEERITKYTKNKKSKLCKTGQVDKK